MLIPVPPVVEQQGSSGPSSSGNPPPSQWPAIDALYDAPGEGDAEDVPSQPWPPPQWPAVGAIYDAHVHLTGQTGGGDELGLCARGQAAGIGCQGGGLGLAQD